MRKVIKTKKIEEVILSTESIFCDLCGTEANNGYWDGSGCYSFNETDLEMKVLIKQKEGFNYPEGGSGKEIVVDICPKCFKNKLVPWLISQGAIIKEKDWSW